MDSCTFRPPNDRYLSDDIIGGVLQGRRPDRYFLAADENDGEEWRQSRQSYLQPQTSERPRVCHIERTRSINTSSIIAERDAVAVLGLLSLMNGTKRQRAPSPSFSSCKRFVTSEARAPQPETDTESLNSDNQEPIMTNWAVPVGRQNHQQTIHRERQIQYRKKQDELLVCLEKETQQLRQEIAKFEQRRRTMYSDLSPTLNGWNVAQEYFQVLRFGLRPIGRRSSPFNNENPQLDLLRTIMAPDVAFNSGQGVEAMMRSWKCLSLWFQDVELELEDLDRSTPGSLVSMTRTTVTITERTLRNVFPHLHRNSGAGARLATKLLGQRIAMRGLTRFVWDSVGGRFTRVIAHSDLLTPLLRLLDSIEDVSLVFDRSIISSDFQWRSML